MSDGLSKETLLELVKLGRQAVNAQEVPDGNTPYAVIPDDCKVEDLSRFRYNDHAARPERIRANVNVLDVQSFAEYYRAYADAASRVFAFEPEAKVVAILDYHEDGKSPRWSQHRLTLNLRKSDEWNVWVARNNKQFTQMEFAEFLEQNGMDIVDPSPASMVEVARDLEAKSEVEFGGGARTSNGQIRFKYSETIKGSMANGAMEVPEQFRIGIPVFLGGEIVQLAALLRYRVQNGKLVLWYTLVRSDAAVREAFLAARDDIAEAIEVTIINGVPA